MGAVAIACSAPEPSDELALLMVMLNTGHIREFVMPKKLATDAVSSFPDPAAFVWLEGKEGKTWALRKADVTCMWVAPRNPSNG